MPDDLRFLTAGIDLTKFCAHHIGFSQTPFNVLNGVPQLQQTAAFGLINYEDPMDLHAEQSIPFGFKTTRLRVRFANAALVDFSAEVELMLNSLLGSSLTKQIAARGNNLIIGGSYQRVGGAPMEGFARIKHLQPMLSLEKLDGATHPDKEEESDRVKRNRRQDDCSGR